MNLLSTIISTIRKIIASAGGEASFDLILTECRNSGIFYGRFDKDEEIRPLIDFTLQDNCEDFSFENGVWKLLEQASLRDY
jgi:hypothetical protein